MWRRREDDNCGMRPGMPAVPEPRHTLEPCDRCHIWHCTACGCAHKSALIVAV
jgi:hypothetical protein